jgi:ubiquinone/menaquinone biosynthesis C-methylase UbiE
MDNTYLTLKYNSKARWLNYWYQISEALEALPDNVLIIGKGSGITEDAIKQLSNEKTKVVTLDINYAVNSDIAGEVTGLPFANASFDVIVCCQVLEHMSFDRFPLALSELHRVVKKRVVLSLPHGGKNIKLAGSLPFLKERTLVLKNPFTKKQNKSRLHHWEIGPAASLNQIKGRLKRLFDIEKDYFNEVSCDQRFFILRRKNVFK